MVGRIGGCVTVRAITFDFWDTLLHDDSDEPKRAALGLAPKATAREKLFVDAVKVAHPDVDLRRIRDAWASSMQHCHRRWKVEFVTPTLEERVDVGFDALGLRHLPGRTALIEGLAWMEAEVPPDPVAGMHEALSVLAQHYRIGIVSDATTTPGRALRAILEEEGVLGHFDHTSFSDEVGHAKPDPAIFGHAAAGLGVEPHELVHIGDREAHDIDGALRCGALAILFTGAVDRGAATSKAHAICPDLTTLPDLISAL